VNIETGETLVSEMNGYKMNMSVSTEGDYIVIKSDNYTVIDNRAMDYISKVLSRSEFSSAIKLTNDLKTPLNIIYNNNKPHTNETLQQYLGFASESMFFKLIKKLMNVGILYQIKGNIMGEVRVIYMFNPFIARQRTTVDKKVLSIFKDIFLLEDPTITKVQFD
jgi:predicted transcriptional regulator